jgi:hypothetical protein
LHSPSRGGFIFIFIPYTNSKRTKNLKPCCRTTQFLLGLHCQAPNQCRTELLESIWHLAKGFTLGVKGDIEKNFSICPTLLINAELYGLVLPRRLKKRIPSNLGGQCTTPWANVPAFTNIMTSMF